jgi:RND family efflux transporter MFP subunit
VAAPAAPPHTSAAHGDIVVPVAAELASRAGIQLAEATPGSVTTLVRVPGTVTPNQYEQVQVASLVGGQVTRVSAQLGDRVRKGTPLAQIFSSELADAQTRYLSARAELAAADERLQRTTRLVSIGAASQQELDQTQADRTKVATNVEGEAARLRLFGMSAAAIARLKSAGDISASLTLASPAEGVVTERVANPGVVVMPSAPLFVISSTSPVWIIAEVAERDLPRVRVGAAATVSAEGLTPSAGTVSYIAPDVRAETRTAQVRVETPNPGGRLRFGMLVSVELASGAGVASETIAVPEAAVQMVGGRSVVYLGREGRPNEFLEREVTTGARADGVVEILSGLQAGDRVVTAGSFYLRAERERLGLRPPDVAAAHDESVPVRLVNVAVTAAGFEPARVEVPAGTHVRLRVTRRVEATCGTDLSVAGKTITERLPLNEPVQVDLGVVTRGEIAFSFGMNMLKGTVVVHLP